MKRLQFIAMSLLLAGGSGATPVGDKPAQAAIVVTIDNFHFSPAEITVPPGSAVKWVNKDDVPHTATAKGKDPAFDSKTLDTDDGFTFTFKTPGVFNYYCKVHPHMTGKVIVK